MSQDAVNSAQIAMLIESNAEIKDILSENGRQQLETNKSLNKLIQAQIRTEERQNADREWQRRVEKHQDKQDEKIESAQETANQAKAQALSNGKWVNLGVAILTAILIYIGNRIMEMLFGG